MTETPDVEKAKVIEALGKAMIRYIWNDGDGLVMNFDAGKCAEELYAIAQSHFQRADYAGDYAIDLTTPDGIARVMGDDKPIIGLGHSDIGWIRRLREKTKCDLLAAKKAYDAIAALRTPAMPDKKAAVTDEIKRIAKSYAPRFGWEYTGTGPGFRVVHEEDLAKGIEAAIKEALESRIAVGGEE